MEVFGHALSGVVWAQLLRPTAASPKGVAAWAALGVAGALAPDVDAVSYLWGAEVFRAVHQVYTHNLLVFAVVPPALGVLAGRRAVFAGARGRALAVVWGAWGLHLLGDTIAHWPEPLFWPFSDQRVAFGLIPGDFSIGLPLVLLVGAALTLADELQRWRVPLAGATLAAGVAYVVVGPGW